MNEWSPGGTYRPLTSNQQTQMRSFRSHFEDQNFDKTTAKRLVVNIRAAADTRSRPNFRRSQEDILKPSLSADSRFRRAVDGSSDPRFKRVIAPGAHNDARVGTDIKTLKTSKPAVTDVKFSDSKNCIPLDRKQKPLWGHAVQPNKDSMKNQCNEVTVDCSNLTAQEPAAFESAQEHLRELDKLSVSHDIAPSSFPKQSLSDCTTNTRNTSLVSEDLRDDYADRLHTFSSTTRVKKVQNWIADQKPKVDKRQSVVTVIGQTQGQGALSSALHEIDQRRKLVKELDKYAICNKITDSVKNKEMSTLVAQINFLSPPGKLLFSGDKRHEVKELPCKLKSSTKHRNEGDKTVKRLQSKSYNAVPCDTEIITEHERSLSPSSDDSSSHLQKKSYHTWKGQYDVKGKIRRIVTRIPYSWLAYFMMFLSGTLCWYMYIICQRNGYFIFEIFPQKPKTTTWYEKMCHWVWELFRPSGNYHRSSTWRYR